MALAIAILAPAAAAQTTSQWCQPTYPPDLGPPPTSNNSICTPGSMWRKGPAIVVPRAADGPTVGDLVDISHGFALQVNPDDIDEHMLTCTNPGTGVEQIMPTADRCHANFAVFASNLPVPGYWEGWGITSTTSWPGTGAVYRLDPMTPPGNYMITFACYIDDFAIAADDPGMLWLIDAHIDVSDCGMTFGGYDNDQLIPLGSNIDVPPTGSNCCDGNAQYLKGPAIRNTASCDGYTPGVVAPEQFTLFACTGQDTDYLHRLCDDQPICQVGLNGNKIDFIEKEDSLTFQWDVHRLNNTPGGVGSFLINPGAETVVWKAPMEPGLLEICVTITNRGHQATDDAVVRKLTQWVLVAPFDVTAQDHIDHALVRQGPELLCPGVRTWVNTDNDDLDAIRDDQQAALGAQEDDLIRVTIPTTAWRVRFHQLNTGTGTTRLHFRANATAAYTVIPFDTWQDPTTFFNREVFIEGTNVSSAYGDILIGVEMDPNAPLWPCAMPSANVTQGIRVTVFGITQIDFLTAPGWGEAKRWSTVTPAALRPSGFADNARAQNAWFIEPCADLNADVPDAGSNPATWVGTRRDHLQVRVTVKPPIAGTLVHFRGFDVDDNSIDTTTWAATQLDYVDDDSATGPEKDNAGLMIDRTTGAELLDVFDGRVSRVGAGATLPIDSTTTDATGIVQFYFITTLSPGDNFRVACSLDATQIPVAAPKVFAPRSAQWTQRNDFAAALAWPAGGADPVPVPSNAFAAGASVLCSDVITVRQVYWIEERVAGAYVTNAANYLVAPGIQAEPQTFGIRRCIAAVTPHPDPAMGGATVLVFPPRGAGGIRGMAPAAIAAELGPVCDNSLRRCARVTPAGVPIMENQAVPAFANGAVFDGGEVDVGGQTLPIQFSSLSEAVLPLGVSVNYNHPAGGGGPSQITKLLPNRPVPGMAVNGIELTVSNAPPPAWVGLPINVLGKVLTIRAVAGNRIYTTTPIELFPATLYSDERGAWWQPGPMALTHAAITATKGGGAAFRLVNHMLRDLCFRIEQFGAPGPVPFRMHLAAGTGDFLPAQTDIIAGSNIVALNYAPTAKSWTAVHLQLPRVMVEIDNDPNGPATTGMTLAAHLRGPGGVAILPPPGYTAICTGYEVEHDFQTFCGLNSALPYGMFAYAAVSFLNMGRARTLAHELQHTISNYEGIAAGAAYPTFPPGAALSTHSIPGLMHTDQNHLVLPDGQKKVDPVLGRTVQGVFNLVKAGDEAGVSPAMIRHMRRTFRYPGVRR